jgi:hypothetical protein
MSWHYIVHGKSFTVSQHLKDVDLHPTYSKLKEQAAEHGLVLGELFDDTFRKHTLFVGYEMHPDRHLYQGQTITCAIDAEKPLPAQIIADLRTWLSSIHEGNVVEADGVIVNHFD